MNKGSCAEKVSSSRVQLKCVFDIFNETLTLKYPLLLQDQIGIIVSM